MKRFIQNIFVFLFLVSSGFLISAGAQDRGTSPLSESEKIQLYNQALSQQNLLEEKVQYSGDDEIIRSRLNLPPKLPPLDKWSPETLSSQSKDTLTKSPDAVAVEKKVDAPVTAPVVTTPAVDTNPTSVSQSSPEQLPAQTSGKAKRFLAFVIPTILLSLNFFLFFSRPKTQRFLIVPPFGIGVKQSTEGGEDRTKFQRLLIESGLFFLAVACAYFVTGIYFYDGVNPNDGVVDIILASLFFYAVGHVAFVGGRLYAGFATKCIKCNTPFARKFVSGYKEPKAQVMRRGFGADVTKPLHPYEVGVRHSNWICTVCSHSWETSKRYETRS